MLIAGQSGVCTHTLWGQKSWRKMSWEQTQWGHTLWGQTSQAIPGSAFKKKHRVDGSGISPASTRIHQDVHPPIQPLRYPPLHTKLNVFFMNEPAPKSRQLSVEHKNM
eukprot:364575-Chlamydomonas_euryale.AAC.3